MAAFFISLDSKPQEGLRILDTEWQVQHDEIQVQTSIENTSDQTFKISIEFLAHHYTVDDYDRALDFVGRTEVEYLSPARSIVPISVSIPTVRKAEPTVQVSPTIITSSKVSSLELKE